MKQIEKKFITSIQKSNYTLNIFVNEILEDEKVYESNAKQLLKLMVS